MATKEKLTLFFSTKPLSWIIMNGAVLVGLAVGLLTFLAVKNGHDVAFRLFKPVFFGCWVIAAAMWFIFMINNISGKYKNMAPTKWKNRPW